MTNKLKIFLPVVSAILLILSFPGFDFEFLAWFAFVPLLYAIEGKKPFQAFLISYLAGVLFFLGTIYWLVHVTLPGMLIVVLYLALYFGIFGLSFACCAVRYTPYAVLFFTPALWVALELVRSRLFGGFGWALLGHSQSYFLPIIQIADLSGAYGVSFLIMIINTAVFLTLRDFRKSKEGLFPYLMAAVFLVFLALTYGIFRLNNIFTGQRLRVAVIQGNIPQSEKWDYGFREEILRKYESLTGQAAGTGQVDLVIWPETSVPGYIETERDLFDRIKSLASRIKTPVLVGAPDEDLSLKDTYYNSALLFAGDGRLLGRYDKIHLVPFGEYVPFKKILSFVERFARSPIGDFTAGRDYMVFSFPITRSFKNANTSWRLLKNVRFSCLICFEDIFPDLARRFVERGAVFLVNITNDAWFGPTSAAYQHAQSSVFRAVENRTNVIRAANTGFSCFIDQKGKITAAVRKNGSSLFVDGFAVQEITLSNARTFYAVYGDLFAYLCFAAALFFILNKRVFTKRR